MPRQCGVYQVNKSVIKSSESAEGLTFAPENVIINEVKPKRSEL